MLMNSKRPLVISAFFLPNFIMIPLCHFRQLLYTDNVLVHLFTLLSYRRDANLALIKR